jgi:hypothetical protein
VVIVGKSLDVKKHYFSRIPLTNVFFTIEELRVSLSVSSINVFILLNGEEACFLR